MRSEKGNECTKQIHHSSNTQSGWLIYHLLNSHPSFLNDVTIRSLNTLMKETLKNTSQQSIFQLFSLIISKIYIFKFTIKNYFTS